MYGEKDVKPWTSSKWTPPGYITRKQRDESHDHDDDATRIGSTETKRAVSGEKKNSESFPSEARTEDASRVV
jgi:MFS transporter, SP family, sugar:H+ symporter